VTITQASPRDVPAIWRLICACRDDLRKRGIDQWDETYPTEQIVIDDVKSGSWYVLQEGVICIAAICLNAEQHPLWEPILWLGREPALIVHRLCVLPDYQGTGKASRLMDFAEHHAAANGYVSIRLDAYPGNPPAISLYERRRYRKAGEVNFSRCALPAFCFEKML